MTVLESKNGDKRTVPLTQQAQLVMARRSKEGSMEGCAFPSEIGTKLDGRNVSRALTIALDKAGIENFTYHDFRHTFATRLAQRGVDIYTIAKLLGHKDIKMTQRYAHHCQESLRQGISVLEKSG